MKDEISVKIPRKLHAEVDKRARSVGMNLGKLCEALISNGLKKTDYELLDAMKELTKSEN